MPAAPLGRLPLPRWIRPALMVLAAACAAFAVSTIPGVRAHPGHMALWDSWVYDGISLGAVTVCFGRAFAVRAERGAWLALGGALLASALGDVTWSVAVANIDPLPFPSIADVGWLAFYPLAYLGLVLLLRGRLENLQLSMWLDGLVSGLSTAAVVAALAFDAITKTATGSPLGIATNLAYPCGDLLLFILVIGVFGLTGWRPGWGWLLMGAGLLVWGVADTIYLYQTANDAYAEGTMLDVMWPVGMVLLATAATRPSPRPIVPMHDWSALVVPSAATVIAATVLALSALGSRHDVAVALSASAVLCAVARTCLTFRDVRQLAATRRLAHTDELTGLANRRALLRRLEAATRADEPVALLLFDLDRFKELNDTLGHPTGDALLRRIGPRLTDAMRPGDLLARLGGDEFAVALAGPIDATAAAAAAERLRAALDRPFDLDGVPAQVDASFGVALHPEHSRDATELLQHADVAMYEAKREHTGVEVYRAERDRHSRDRLALAAELRSAMARGEIELWVQPQVAAESGAVVGAEALVRWRHPAHGVLMPSDFLPAVQQTHVMRELTDHLIAAALRARAGWLREGLRVPVSVNLATANLLDAELPARVAHRLAEAGANASALRLELTETALMVDAERSAHVLGGLRRLGVGLSLDHFGAGNSSLSMLKRLPVDQLKLDRAFGKRVADDARDASIVAATLLMAGPFGLTVVAEGVESEVAYSALRLAGCPVLQGFAIAEPMPAERLPVWARAWATARPMWARGSEDGPAATVVAGVRTLRAR